MKIGKIFVVVCCLLAIAATPTQDEGPITVSETEIINDYPELVTFEIKAASTAATITSIDLCCRYHQRGRPMEDPAWQRPTRRTDPVLVGHRR